MIILFKKHTKDVTFPVILHILHIFQTKAWHDKNDNVDNSNKRW